MTSTRTAAAAETAISPAEAHVERSPAECLEQARRAAWRAVPAVMAKMIELAEQGSFQHGKFVIEWAGAELDAAASGGGEGDSLAALLLRELREEDPGSEGDGSRVQSG